MNDDKIVKLYLNKDEAAITWTKAKYGNQLRRISYYIVNNESDAEECENDTYLSAWNSIPPKSPETYLFSFLAKIIRNFSINLYNKKHTQKRYAHLVVLTKEMEECLPNPNDELCKVYDDELLKSMNTFLEGLKEEERYVFLRRYWYTESIKDISLRFSFGESKVKTMLYRTRVKLKNHFIKEGLDL